MTQSSAKQPRVAYLMTHYPQLAQTFIAGEIDALERLGLAIEPFAINASQPADLASSAANVRQARTTVLKQTPKKALLSILRRAEPGPLLRTLTRARRFAGPDAKALAKHVAYVAEGLVLWDAMRRKGVTHVHAQFGQTTAWIAYYAQAYAAATGADATWSFTIHGFHDFVNEREIRLDAKAATATHVVCISDFTKSQLMRVSDPAHWSKFAVVRCGIDIDAFAFSPKSALRDPARITLVARISAEKGHLLLLEALRLLHERGTSAVVEFVGDGPYADQARAEAQRLGVGDCAIWRGALPPDRVNEALAEADVFCLPSFAEGLPVSIMEAMAVGVPVVSTFISGIPELAEHGETALLAPPGNAVALADALHAIINDAHLRSRLVHNARKRVEQQHDQTLNAPLIHSLLRPHAR